MRVWLSTVLLVAAAFGSPARGGDHQDRWWWPLRPSCPCCPDDYHAKPLPTVCPVKCFGPDDYHAKPLPTVCPVKCFGPDDYCAKPLPRVTPCYPSWYTCGNAPTCVTGTPTPCPCCDGAPASPPQQIPP
jgi:hypothetical protein